MACTTAVGSRSPCKFPLSSLEPSLANLVLGRSTCTSCIQREAIDITASCPMSITRKASKAGVLGRGKCPRMIVMFALAAHIRRYRYLGRCIKDKRKQHRKEGPQCRDKPVKTSQPKKLRLCCSKPTPNAAIVSTVYLPQGQVDVVACFHHCPAVFFVGVRAKGNIVRSRWSKTSTAVRTDSEEKGEKESRGPHHRMTHLPSPFFRRVLFRLEDW